MDITVENLSKKYDNTVVFENFSTTFESGMITAVMGRSGIGKTTLLNCISGITDYSGNIAGAEKTSYVFQEDRLVPNLTVYGNLELVLGKETPKNKKFSVIKEILSDVGLTEKLADLPSRLSGGEKKRVALARAFISGSPTMLLDEPMNSLDIGLKYKIIRLFLDLNRKYGRTAIYVTHDLDEAVSVADKVIVIAKDGVTYSRSINSDKFSRKVTDEECISVKKEILYFLI